MGVKASTAGAGLSRKIALMTTLLPTMTPPAGTLIVSEVVPQAAVPRAFTSVGQSAAALNVFPPLEVVLENAATVALTPMPVRATAINAASRRLMDLMTDVSATWHTAFNSRRLRPI